MVSAVCVRSGGPFVIVFAHSFFVHFSVCVRSSSCPIVPRPCSFVRLFVRSVSLMAQNWGKKLSCIYVWR